VGQKVSHEISCDFLLVINSNLGRILPCFRDIADFFPAKKATPPLFHAKFGGVPLELDHFAYVGAPRSEDTMLIIRTITFELTQPTELRYVNLTDRQTDRQTDGLMIAIPRFALRAQRGNSETACAMKNERTLSMASYIRP